MNKKLTKPALAAPGATPMFWLWYKNAAKVYGPISFGPNTNSTVAYHGVLPELQVV